jgi:IS4 transposase
MRFGIEASYRIMNQARAGTTSTKAQMRLLLVAIAFLLQNLWVSLKRALALLARRRHALAPVFTLDLLCHLISARVEAIYGTLDVIEL